jgi:hypothetical protein
VPIGITPEDMRILELHKKGELQDALVIKNTDFTKLDEKEVLRFKFNQENKGMPQKIRDRQFEKMYDAKYSESVDDTDDDIEEKKYYLKTDAENARLDLEKKQNELFKVEANSYKTKAQQEQEQLALQNDWIKSVDETLDFIGKTVTIGEGDEAYNYILEQEQQEELKSFMTDPITFIANLTKDSKGEINKQELAKIGIRMLFGDDIHEKRTPFLVQKGKLDKIIEYRNPSPSINTGARSAANTDPHMNSILEWAKTAR